MHRASRRPLAAGLAVALAGAAGAMSIPVTSAAAATSSVAVAPIADTYTDKAAVRKNFGSVTKLVASDSTGKTTYFKFAVPAVPSGMKLAGATLATQSASVQPATVNLNAVASTTWGESTLTAATAPATGAVVASVSAAGATALSFDVSKAVVPGTTQSFAMSSPSGTASATSREVAASAPKLTLTFAPLVVTRYGTTLYTGDGSTLEQAFTRESAYYGALESVRLYYTGLPSAWPGKASVTSGPVVLSFKAPPQDINAGKHDAFFTTWFAGIPKDRLVYWVYYHEPEDNVEDGLFTAADYRAAYRRLDSLADKAANPNLKTTTIWMSWSLEAGSGRNWQDYYPGSDVVDVMAWDSYNSGVKKTPQFYETPSSMFDKFIAVAASQGKPWGLGEFGSLLVSGDDGTARAAWLRQSVEYQRSHGAEFIHYFDAFGGSGNPPEYRLLDQPSQDAWRWAVSGS